MDLSILAANIRRIRNTKGLSQKALADASAISLPSIKNIELCKNEPRVQSLQAIAHALGVGIKDLFLDVKILKTVRFRSAKKMQHRENILSQISRRLDDFNYLETLTTQKRSFALRNVQKKCSASHIAQSARLCRQALGLKPSESIRDLCGLLEHAGIKLFPLKMESPHFFGLSVGEEDGGPAIVVNTSESISIERQIFSAAHELGHLMLHIDEYNVDNVQENKEEEQQANLFAGHFLMPDEGFWKEWDEAAGLSFVDRVFKVKRIFHVSYKAILSRLLEHGKVDKSIWMKFNVAYSQQYHQKLTFSAEPEDGKSIEPFALAIFDFYEERFRKLVRLALEADKISVSRGAELLGISIEQLQKLILEWRMA